MIEDGREWVMYNDEYLKRMAGGWKSLVNDCVEIQAYPTVLLYERVDQKSLKDLEFNVAEDEINALAQVASIASSDVFEFCEEDIELQRKLLENPKYELSGGIKAETISIYGVYWIVRDEKKEIICQEFRQKPEAERLFKEIQYTSKIMTFGRKVVKEWFHNNKKIETRRIKAFFNSGANVGKAL